MAGDRGAAKAVHGRSKVYLELGGEQLVAYVVRVLQRVPEVADVWVVGDRARLEEALGSDAVQRELRKPLHVLEQFRNLYENAWETYRRLLPGAPLDGRDPEGAADLDTQVLYLSGDLPFATPQEVSSFVQRSRAVGCDYALGLVPEECIEPFYPATPDGPGIHPAYFNIREGRLRQNNLHLVRPGRIGNRHYVQDMYEHRYQKQFGNMVSLGMRLLRSEQGGLKLLFYYLLMHLASLCDRWAWRHSADRLRGWVPMPKVEATVGQLLRCSFRFVATDVGGCAVDIDLDSEYDAALARLEEWRSGQAERAEKLHGPLPLPERAGP